MLARLDEQLKPMQTLASQMIKPLGHNDFYEMLFELEMILRPKPTKRDEQDAQEFIEILLRDAEGSLNAAAAGERRDVADIQQANREKMAVFCTMVRALLLHETDGTLIAVH